MPIDLSQDDILNSAFIRKIALTDFEQPLKECDAEIRADLLELMKAAVNAQGH